MPFFSVIIPSYNRKQQLSKAMDSVLNQSFSDYELIIVDDGSTDGTEDLFNSQNPRIKYIKTDNFGVSAARNKGIKESRGEHIAFLDSDDIWQKEKLQENYKFLKDNPHIKIHQTNDIWIRNNRRVNPAKKHIKESGDIFQRSLQLCLISPSAVVISRKLFEKYGLFDEALPACEDYDLWIRITPFENIGLINKNLVTRYAGHHDQLSQKYQAMDKFRIYSLLKLWENSSEKLTGHNRKMISETLERKISILRGGAMKRGNQQLLELLEQISSLFPKCMHKDYRDLLEL